MTGRPESHKQEVEIRLSQHSIQVVFVSRHVVEQSRKRHPLVMIAECDQVTKFHLDVKVYTSVLALEARNVIVSSKDTDNLTFCLRGSEGEEEQVGGWSAFVPVLTCPGICQVNTLTF